MANAKWMSLPLALAFAAALSAGAQSAASTSCSPTGNSAIASDSSAASRLSGDWQTSSPFELPATVPPVLHDSVDLGLAPGGTRLDRMLLLLEPSPAQRKALDTLLARQQNPGSCDYHHWLTPSQFAAHFANTSADVATVAGWLRSQGFTVAPLPAGRAWIEFSGTAEQVTPAFHAPVHKFSTPSGTRFALTTSISIPSALAPLVRGLVSLDGSSATAAITPPRSIPTSPADLAAETDIARAEALTPQLAARLVHLAGIPRGTGESIAIAAGSNIQPGDIAAFRSTFALPTNPVSSSPAGADPGLTADRAAIELAASWAGVAAPDARILVVPAAHTAATDALDLSLASILDRDQVHTIVIPYSSCEASLSSAHQAFYAALYRQAAALGISIVAASGDSGAAACHAPASSTEVTTGYAVNALAATPWNTAIGAAALNSQGAAGSQAASGSQAAAGLAAWSPVSPADPAFATGGGRSTTYARPPWQPALSSTDTARLLPDISLPTALDTAFSRGLAFCFSGSATPSGCTLVRSGGSAGAAALFAGISASLAQQYGPQGNLAPRLYTLRSDPGVFADIREGAARLACTPGTQGCDTSATMGFDAAEGYDLATGLGMPSASRLISVWATPDVGTTASTVNLTVSPTQPNATYNPQATITFNVNIVGGSGTPTGTVNFFDQATSANLNSAPYALDSTGATSITLTGAMPQGGNSIIAQYSGDSTYAAQNSQALTVNIQPSTTTTTVTPATTTPKVGSAFNVTASVTVGSPPAGTLSPTGSITLTLDGATYAASAVSTTGGTTSATFSVTVTSSGSHNLQAIYSGDTNFATSTSNAVPVNASSNPASVTLTVSPTQPNGTYNPSAAITFAAAVASQNGGAIPTGAVDFFDQATGTNLNTSALTVDSAGKAKLAISGGLPTGGNSVIAKYSGDNNYGASNSQAVTVNIQPSTTTPTVSPSTTTPAAGTAFPVTVTIAVGLPAAGTASPSGKVTLTLDGATYATANLATASGVTSAKFSVTIAGGGSHNLQAIYAGDSNYAASTSSTVAVTVSKGATVTTLTATPATLSAGTPETLTATIAAANSSSSATNTFTGTVTFFDGSSQIGTATVTGNSASLPNITLSTTTTHALTAVYAGDDTWSGSTSNIVTLKAVLIPVTITLAVTPTNAAPGQVVSMIATVTPTIAPASAIEQNPTGSVIFYNGTKILATVALSAGANNTSTAELLFTTLPAGQDTLSAAYLGDLFYNAATSNTVTITVQDFSITPDPSNPPSDLDIVKGTSGQAAFIFTGLGGFNGQIAVTCAVPAQDDMTCTPNPTSLTPTGTVTFTVTTYLTGGPATAHRDASPIWPRAASGTALAALLFFLLPFGRRTRIFSDHRKRLFMLVLLLGTLAASGIGCSSVSGSVANSDGTPLGQTTLAITAASNVDNTVFSHTIYLSVNVLPPGATGTAQPAPGAR